MTPFQTWYDATFVRRSRRKFDSRPLPAESLSRLQQVCEEFVPLKAARSVLVNKRADKVFRGAIGPYGKIKGSPAYIAFIGSASDPFVNEKLGYTGEGIILEATVLGLATCWVAGLFRSGEASSAASAESDEKVFAVSPVGFSPPEFTLEEKIMTGFGRNHRRRPLSELVTGVHEKGWPVWLKPVLDCARSAPSAINRQPWRFHIEQAAVTISVDSPIGLDFGISKRLDCGIAMLHLEIAASVHGIKGKWEFLESPQVARFSF